MGMRQPAGVVLGIAPWNAPIILGVRAIATPLACGNTVVLKGIGELPAHPPADHRGLPGGRLSARRGQLHHQRAGRCRRGGRGDGRAPGGAARQLHRLDQGRASIIAQTCAKYLKPVVLELGGKAPLVVLDDADLDAAVNAAAFGAFANSGQICMSTERIVVDQKVADEFVDEVRRQGHEPAAGRPAQAEPVVLGSVVGMSTVRPLQRADRRCAGQGRQAGVRRQGRQHADAGDACSTT